MAIRYDKKLNQQINKTIKNFNQKIARLEKEERQLLPSKITKKELKSDYTRRTDLVRKLKELQRFSKRGAEDIITSSTGIRTTRYELTNLIKERSRAKRSLTREIKRLETESPTIFGKKQFATYAQMGSSRYLNVKKKRQALEKDIRKMDREEYERYKKLIGKINKSYDYLQGQFKNSYLDMLTDLGYHYGYDTEKLEKLKEKIIKLDDDKFVELFNRENSIKAITEYYPTMKKNNKEDYDSLKSDVTQLYDNIINNIDDILKDYV